MNLHTDIVLPSRRKASHYKLIVPKEIVILLKYFNLLYSNIHFIIKYTNYIILFTN